MCGRYARYQALTAWIESLESDVHPDLLTLLEDDEPRYNITPGTKSWIFGLDVDGELFAEQAKWSFPTPRGNRINIRSETAGRVPEYREPFNRHRIVLPASGFYEPEGPKTQKVRPWWYFQLPNAAPMFLGAVAGPDGFSILTRAPVDPVAKVHDRTPVIVPADCVLQWMDDELSGNDALSLANVEYGRQLDAWRVSDAAKRPSNEGPELIQPVQENVGLFG